MDGYDAGAAVAAAAGLLTIATVWFLERRREPEWAEHAVADALAMLGIALAALVVSA